MRESVVQTPSNLEEILCTLGEDVRNELMASLNAKKKLPGVGFYGTDKWYLIEAIIKAVEPQYRQSFQKMLNRLGKGALQSVRRGQLNFSIPAEILDNLPPWAAIYMYAGVWYNKDRGKGKGSLPADLKAATIYEIVYACIMDGMDHIEDVHNKIQNNKRGHIKNRGKAIKPPYKAPARAELELIFIPPTQKYATQTLLPIDDAGSSRKASVHLPDPSSRERYHSPSSRNPIQLLLPLTS